MTNYWNRSTPSEDFGKGIHSALTFFSLWAKGLVNLINHEISAGRVNPIKIARNSPEVSNLLSADDNLIFFKASIDQAGNNQEGSGHFPEMHGTIAKCKQVLDPL